MKVWIVTEGEHYDYRTAVFSSPELARQYSKRHKVTGSGVYETEEWEVDTPETVKPHVRVYMEKDGNVFSVESSDGPAGLYSWGRGIFGWVVETDDEERAIKIVNEKRVQIIAADAWGNKARLKELGLAPEPPVERQS